jgi:hypothetical protein
MAAFCRWFCDERQAIFLDDTSPSNASSLRSHLELRAELSTASFGDRSGVRDPGVTRLAALNSYDAQNSVLDERRVDLANHLWTRPRQPKAARIRRNRWISRVFRDSSEFPECRKSALTLFGNCHILPPHACGNGSDRDHEWRARQSWREQQIRSDNPRGWVCIREGARVFLRTTKGAAGMDARRCFSIFVLVSDRTIHISACQALDD